MHDVPILTLLASICVGLALSASCGLRAFLPLLVAGLSARLGYTPLADSFTWLQETPALVALGVAVLVELAADKVPALDHALDVIQSPVRVVAGGVAIAAVLAPCPTWAHVLMGMVGGSAALSVHLTKAAVRVGSSATTAGAANPFVSLAEDALCLVASVLSVLLTACAAVFALLALVWVVKVVLKLRARWREAAEPELY
jgi:hypothetical protein